MNLTKEQFAALLKRPSTIIVVEKDQRIQYLFGTLNLTNVRSMASGFDSLKIKGVYTNEDAFDFAVSLAKDCGYKLGSKYSKIGKHKKNLHIKLALYFKENGLYQSVTDFGRLYSQIDHHKAIKAEIDKAKQRAEDRKSAIIVSVLLVTLIAAISVILT